jgi:hypothetical protein
MWKSDQKYKYYFFYRYIFDGRDVFFFLIKKISNSNKFFLFNIFFPHKNNK